MLDEAGAVADACARLALACRAAGVRFFSDVSTVLAAAAEPVVFNLVEGFHAAASDAMLVPAAVASFGKAATGSDTACLALTLDKWRTKSVLAAAGLSCPQGTLVPLGKRPPSKGLARGTWIVKPAHSDAGEGIDDASVVRGARAVAAAVKRVHAEVGQDAIVEDYIDGRELNVSLIEREGRVEVLPIAEIVFRDFAPGRPRIVGYPAKWHEGSFEYENTVRVVPTRLPRGVAAKVRAAALGAWHAVGASDYARVDMRLDRRNRIYILEVNPNPDITPGAGFASALAAGGISYDAFVAAAVANAFARWNAARGARDVAAASCARCRRASSAAPAPLERPVALADAEPVIRVSEPGDRDAIVAFLEATGFFRPDEVVVAAEVLDEALAAGPGGHYQSFTCEVEGRPVGWVCCGPTPCTVETWDIYWIGVDPAAQGRGVGRRLMAHAERLIAERGGRIAVIETSGAKLYEPTQGFYLRVGYAEEARIADFYAPGDAKIVYIKRLD